MDADPELEIVVLEHDGSAAEALVLEGDGSPATLDPAVAGLWPAALQAQSFAPMSYGAAGTRSADTEGVVFAFTDTISGEVSLRYVPLVIRSAPTNADAWTTSIDIEGEIPTGFAPVSMPVLADLDVDGFDEVLLTLPSGQVVVYDPETGQQNSVDLRAANPSAPAVGDLDGDGTQEIALWDDTHMYVYENNLALRTDWPRAFIPTTQGSFPPLSFERRLNSPLIGSPTGAGVKVVFPTTEGTLYAFDADGGAVSGFPRSLPNGAEATPTMIDLQGTGELSFVSIGYAPLLRTIEAVSDTIESTEQTVLSIQTLPGSDAQDQQFWTQYQNSLTRHGRVTESNPLKSAGEAVDSNTFIVYPNPVRGDELHARVILNQSAEVQLDVFNLEGQRAVSKKFTANPGNLIATPFDEMVDVANLSAGVYMLRLKIDASGGSETLVKTFAILR